MMDRSREIKQFKLLMLHFMVDSAQQWYEHILAVGLTEKFAGTKVSEPALQLWGLLITYVWDPAGVLLHLAEEHLVNCLASTYYTACT